MSEMVGRMVVAACRHMAETGADFNSVDEGLAGLARAMLIAAREPTEAMAAAGSNFVAYGDHGSVDVWRSMIDEALR